MKHSLYLLLTLSLLLCALCTSCRSSSQQSPQAKATASGELVASADPSLRLLTDSLLPPRVDCKQEIGHLSYQELRLLKNYVYALHGYWFREADLNSFFINRTDWYYPVCDSLYWEWEEGKSTHYADTRDQVELTDDEKTFVQKIDQRMEALTTHKEITREGCKLINPSLCVNLFQLNTPDASLMQMLGTYNCAMAPTEYEQLFNIYEHNDYRQMPNFITTDLYLQAFHMYFSYVLKSLEKYHFVPALRQLLHALYTESMQLTQEKAIRHEAEYAATFFAIAHRLLTDSLLPVPSTYQEAYAVEWQQIAACQDAPSPLLDYTDVTFPYSLFKPRGHYTRDEESQRYFRVMMWLQSAAFCRESNDALWRTLVMATALNRLPGDTRNALLHMHQALTFLMGEPDNASILEIAEWMESDQLTAATLEKDEKVATEINTRLVELSKTRNRIRPKIELSCRDKINFMPQRYMADNEILGEMVDVNPNSERAYPKGLDVFAALGVESATALLDTCYQEEKNWKEYRPTAQRMKQKFASRTDWDRTMYDKWMEALVALQRTDKTYPGFMHTQAWQCKTLQTALASWTELKHDALLYGEQPMGAECGGAGLPNPIVVGYIEPNRPFWQKLKELLTLNRQILEKTGYASPDLLEKSSTLEEKVDFCLRVVEKELRDESLSEEEYNTIRVMGSSIEWFTLSVIEPGVAYYYWNELKGAERSIALVSDVYTRNVRGCEKNGILHEATGKANALYVLVDIAGEPYITCGATFSYYEFVRPLGERLTDEAWQEMLQKGEAPAPPRWMRPFLLRQQPTVNEGIFYSTGC